MFIKNLRIVNQYDDIIRDLSFSSGLNLIVDDTPPGNSKLTGNNVGKTTVLKLIDFCLGAKGKIVYTDTENKKQVYDVVKDFLTDNGIRIILTLAESLVDPNLKEIEIERNFLANTKSIRKINGKQVLEKDFENELEKILFPNKKIEKPTFRQVISHNIRYTDESISNTLKTLNKFTSDVEYETLYLYLLGCSFDEGARKQELVTKINQERLFKEHLEKKQDKNTYEIALSLVEDDIAELNRKKSDFNLNESLEQDLEELNDTKYQINKLSALIGKLELRKNLIEESRAELEKRVSSIDLQQLHLLYNEAKVNIEELQKTFDDLVAYHNNMVLEKIKYISSDLPRLNDELNTKKSELRVLLNKEKELTNTVSKSDSLDELEDIIAKLNDKYREKGEFETVISQLTDIDDTIEDINSEINQIDDYLYSETFENKLKEQIKKFNKFFSSVSQELYDERYALTYEKKTNKKGQKFYSFSSFNANMSSGKKQGEILCFDLALLLFSEAENQETLQFLLNDKKELMHDNQLVKVADYIQNKNIQLVVSILRDKLPLEIINKAHMVVELSPNDKLFKIER